MYPPCGSGYISAIIVVWRPFPDLLLTWPILTPQSGKSAAISEDLPTPEWPESTDVRQLINWRKESSPLDSGILVTKTLHPNDEYNSLIGFISETVDKSALLRISRVSKPPEEAATKKRSTKPSLKGGSRKEATMRSVSALLTKICSGTPKADRLESFVRRGSIPRIQPESSSTSRSISTSSPTAILFWWRLTLNKLPRIRQRRGVASPTST